MPDIDINGVHIKFPFTPYAIQRNYMERVIECLQTKRDAVLESPTGTSVALLTNNIISILTFKLIIQSCTLWLSKELGKPSVFCLVH